MQQLDTNIDRLGLIASATLRASAVDLFEALVAPGDVFRHPREVLTYPNLTTGEKRAILASWASDAHAVNSCPALRRLQGCRAEPVSLDAILAALQALDGEPVRRRAEAEKPRLPFVFRRHARRGDASGTCGFN
jgi:hypothetical protein